MVSLANIIEMELKISYPGTLAIAPTIDDVSAW